MFKQLLNLVFESPEFHSMSLRKNVLIVDFIKKGNPNKRAKFIFGEQMQKKL